MVVCAHVQLLIKQMETLIVNHCPFYQQPGIQLYMVLEKRFCSCSINTIQFCLSRFGCGMCDVINVQHLIREFMYYHINVFLGTTVDVYQIDRFPQRKRKNENFTACRLKVVVVVHHSYTIYSYIVQHPFFIDEHILLLGPFILNHKLWWHNCLFYPLLLLTYCQQYVPTASQKWELAILVYLMFIVE